MSTKPSGRKSQSRKVTKKAIFLALALACTATAAQAQTLSAQDIARRMIERRAIEAVIRGMPAVNTDLMYQEMLKLGGKPNQIVYWSSSAAALARHDGRVSAGIPHANGIRDRYCF